jgi:hypothetical protein
VTDKDIAGVGCAGAAEEEVVGCLGNVTSGTLVSVGLVEAVEGSTQTAAVETDTSAQSTCVTAVVFMHVRRSIGNEFVAALVVAE